MNEVQDCCPACDAEVEYLLKCSICGEDGCRWCMRHGPNDRPVCEECLSTDGPVLQEEPDEPFDPFEED